MKKQPNLSLICSLLCAAGSLWIAISELLIGDASAHRRTFHVFLALASCAVWVANLVVELYYRKAHSAAETDYFEEIEEDHDHE